MRPRSYKHVDAINNPAEKDGLVRRGWIWRPHSGTVKWTFTSNITTGRAYPAGAEFVPVYVEEL